MKIFLTLLALFGFVFKIQAAEPGRFFYEGDGKISLANKNSGVKVSANYRNNDGNYSASSLQQINKVFGMPSTELGEDISLRLISLLDYLQDTFSPNQTLVIFSGYRSPTLNAKLRRAGKTAGETSYHMDGMAADVLFPGVPSEKVWEYVQGLNVGGVGYYGGTDLHIDSGRPRFWTKATALPKGNEPQENKNIYLSIDKDIYHPGETIQLFFSGISQFPIGVKPIFRLGATSFTPEFQVLPPPLMGGGWGEGDHCVLLTKRKEARLITWTIPENISTSDEKKLAVEVQFCGPEYSKMPKEILSRSFVIRKYLNISK